MSKPVSKLSDQEVLEQAGDYGPGIIGQELYERAQQIKRDNPQGQFGPALLGDGEDAKKKATPRAGRKAAEKKDADAQEGDEGEKEPGGMVAVADKKNATITVASAAVAVPRAGRTTHPASPEATAARRTPKKKAAAKKKAK